jgi:uncharacterized membrane protein
MISTISNVDVPENELIKGRNIRENILNEIKKDYPTFGLDDFVTADELDKYRKKYIENKLNAEISVDDDSSDIIVNSILNKTLLTANSDTTEKTTFGDRLADNFAKFGGSWGFIIFFCIFILVWILLNVILLINKGFDPYPFILLNLILSCLGSLQAPIIMMSQNRQSIKDRKQTENDYKIDLKSEIELHLLHEKIDHIMIVQQEKQMESQEEILDLLKEIKTNKNKR